MFLFARVFGLFFLFFLIVALSSEKSVLYEKELCFVCPV